MARHKDRATAYARRVVAGSEVACAYVRWACERHLRDLKERRWLWDLNSVNHVFAFVELLKHVKGKFAGKRFTLEPFQEFVLGSVFGWRDRKTGHRRFREVYCEVARKNGKSFLCSSVGLYGLVADADAGGGPEIYAVATKIDQAKIIWQVAEQMIRGNSDLRDILKLRQHAIYNDANNGIFRPLSSDSKTLDGLNPSIALNDEVHKWTDSHLYHVIKDGMGARTSPLIFNITTAGASREGICWELRSHLEEVLKPENPMEDERFFGFITSIDEGDDWRDELAWRKANPMLGISLDKEQFAEEARQAGKIASRRSEFQNTRLNVWMNFEEGWLDVNQWRALKTTEINENDLLGKQCYIGVDLASSVDLTAIALVFPDIMGKTYVKMKFYLPKARIQEALAGGKKMTTNYRYWHDHGHLKLGGDKIIEDDVIFAELKALSEKYRVERVCIDPALAQRLVLRLEDELIDYIAVRQNFLSLNAGARELEKMIADKAIIHCGNPIMSWNIDNVVVMKDGHDNIKPTKKQSIGKIDGVAALINALCVMVSEDAFGGFGDYLPPGHPARMKLVENNA